MFEITMAEKLTGIAVLDHMTQCKCSGRLSPLEYNPDGRPIIMKFICMTCFKIGISRCMESDIDMSNDPEIGEDE